MGPVLVMAGHSAMHGLLLLLPPFSSARDHGIKLRGLIGSEERSDVLFCLRKCFIDLWLDFVAGVVEATPGVGDGVDDAYALGRIEVEFAVEAGFDEFCYCIRSAMEKVADPFVDDTSGEQAASDHAAEEDKTNAEECFPVSHNEVPVRYSTSDKSSFWPMGKFG